ncbi:MAG: ABC transporter permease [Candidatus Hodarchaeota archaeon]
MTSALQVAYSAAWRRVIHMTKYRANFIGQIMSALLSLGLYILFVPIMDLNLIESTTGTRNLAGFMFVGIAFNAYINVALWETAIFLQSDMELGKLEWAFTCPISRYSYIVGNAIGVAFTRTLFFIPMFIFALLFVGFGFSSFDLILGLTAALICIAALVQLGAMFSSLVLKYRKVNSIFGVFDLIFRFIGGAYVPVQTFPFWLQGVAMLIPTAFGIDLLRVYLLHTTPILLIFVGNHSLALILEWLILIVQLGLFYVIAKIAIAKGEKAGMKEGFYYL